MPEPETSVERLLSGARAGSQEALGQALEACRDYLLLVARRELGDELLGKGGASDLVQEALLDAVRDFDRFQGNTEEDLLRWLRRLLMNNLIDFTRQFRDAQKRRAAREAPLLGAGSSADLDGGVEAALPSPSEEVLAGEQLEAVQRALQVLPDDYRQVILWRYQEERSFEEIGNALGLTPNAARKLLLRALRRVQQQLGET
jgi:RNA polymerase sigma-70 factor (ECF subfamily)